MFFIKRLFFVFFGLFLLVPCLVFSVSAKDLSWKDLVTRVDVDGGTVRIEMPATPSTFDVRCSGLDHVDSFNGVGSMVYPFKSYDSTGYEYSLQITPSSDNFLYVGNIPDDTEINIFLDISSVVYPDVLLPKPAWDFSLARYNAHLYLFNEAKKRIAFRTMSFGEIYFPGSSDEVNRPSHDTSNGTMGYFYASAILSDVLGSFDDTTEYLDNAKFFRGTYFFEGMRFYEDTDCRITVQSYELVMHLDDLISSDGEYSELLEVILSSLEKRGQTLDFLTGEIIRNPVVTRPAGSNVVDGLVRFDTDFSSSAALGYDNALSFSTGVDNVLSSFGPALLAASSIIDKAVSIPFFDSILVVSVGLGVFGLLVNLVNQFISSRRSSPEPRSKNHKKKGD